MLRKRVIDFIDFIVPEEGGDVVDLLTIDARHRCQTYTIDRLQIELGDPGTPCLLGEQLKN